MSTTNQQVADSSTAVDLELWGDLVSPLSWVVKQRLEAAVHAFERPSDVTVTWRALVQGPTDEDAVRRAVADAAEVARSGDDDELVGFDPERIVPADSRDAQRLIALALAQGGHGLQSAAVERFCRAHFAEGLDIADHQVLQRLGAECGLDERRTAAVLAADDYEDAVRADEDAARSLGITQVPVVVANRSAALTGARSADDYLALLRGVVTAAG
ncbi:putative DsbA family dithiol-disulfide isomerase [Terracoccus luteus]|jgi:predicted DsbA family dithiol-disulfide isomerase|uniref:Putative DsbA family dithiol-disulfide isomerase n=1 Tax=Terracoccus luteus TaxID=53356 RepID=A0A495Y088_9MICO|nr:DsbA family protein [Terracoccus luteus]RKT78815.1 putative DsbA family dithiol-disulfide isomerase [Terracoccus luteus]